MGIAAGGWCVCVYLSRHSSRERQRETVCVCTCLGIVAGGHQQVSQHQQLVISELLFVLLPVVMVSPAEVRQSLLHRHLQERERGG